MKHLVVLLLLSLLQLLMMLLLLLCLLRLDAAQDTARTKVRGRAADGRHHHLLSQGRRVAPSSNLRSGNSRCGSSSVADREEGCEGPGGLLMLLLKGREVEGYPAALEGNIDMKNAFIFTGARLEGSSSSRCSSGRARGNE